MKSYPDTGDKNGKANRLFQNDAILRLLILIVCALIGCISLFAQDTSAAAANSGQSIETMIADADSAYKAGDYEKCQKLYEAVIERNGATASLLYNLANAFYKGGNEGYARLYLERAKRLDPSNKRINSNLEYLATRINDSNKAELKGKKGDVVPDEPGFFGNVRRHIAVDTSSNAWAEMAAMAFILLILSLTLYFFSTSVKFKKIGFFSAIIFVIFSVIFVIFSEMAATEFQSKDEVILTSFKATLKATPSESAKDVGVSLHRGTKLTIIDTEMDINGEIGWYRLKLNNSNIGWLPVEDVTAI